MPSILAVNDTRDEPPIVKSTNKPNSMQARLPVQSQFNVDAWKNHLEGYLDRQ